MLRIMVLGAGALGGYFGAHLQNAGHDVTFVARGRHLEAMQAKGLRVESPAGDLHLGKVRAVATPGEAGPADLVLFMVKNYDVEAAAQALLPTLDVQTTVLTVQNGVAAQEHLGRLIGFDRVLPGAAYMPADIKAPGVIRHSADLRGFVFGAFDGRANERSRTVAEAFARTNIDVTRSKDIWKTLWEKYILLTANSAITTMTRLNIGPIREAPESRALLRRLVGESAAIARAEHSSIPADAADAAFDFLMTKAPPTMHASMLDDLQRGKRLELDWFSGDVVKRGRTRGIATPSHAFAYAVLSPYKNGPPEAARI